MKPCTSINVALAKRGMKQKELAKALGWGESYMSQLCRGDKDVTFSTIQRIADYFEMPLSEFIALGE